MTVRAMEGVATALGPAKAAQIPFEHLPNLPRALVPQIDLGISRVDVLAIQ